MRQGGFTTECGVIRYWITKHPEAGKPWLVMLPGLTFDHRLFSRQVRNFTGRYNMLAWDAPGHFESRPFVLEFGLEDQARWLSKILELERVTNFVLIGQSMGGCVSQAFIDLFPGRARGFIAIDSVPLQWRYYPYLELKLLDYSDPIISMVPWKVLRGLASYGASTSSIGRKFVRNNADSYDHSYYRYLSSHGFTMLSDYIKNKNPSPLSCPTILICGQFDFFGNVKSLNRRWAKKEGLPIHWIYRASHNSNVDNVRVVNKLIEDFVDGLG